MLWRIEHTQVGVYTLVLSVYGALPWRCLVYHTACLPVRPDCKKGITHTHERFDTLLIRGHDIKAIEGADKPYLPKIRPYLPKITLIFYS